ncbi:MAG: NADP-dependent oxidoreductase, partial [Acidimicrobiales bacterium]
MTDSTPGEPIGPNRQLRLAQRPVGLVTEADFEMVEVPVPDLVEGEALMRTIYL